MHEYSVAQALIERVEKEARSRGAASVRSLSIRVGELSGVDASLLASAYTLIRAGTLCAAADLAIESLPVRWECGDCGWTLPSDSPLRCPHCAATPHLATGGELLLESIEIEVP